MINDPNSGKKKAHTRKTQVVVNPQGRIGHVTKSAPDSHLFYWKCTNLSCPHSQQPNFWPSNLDIALYPRCRTCRSDVQMVNAKGVPVDSRGLSGVSRKDKEDLITVAVWTVVVGFTICFYYFWAVCY